MAQRSLERDSNMIASQSIGRLSRAIRWRLGRRVAAPELEAGGDESIASFYRGRITDCSFLSDRAHYEYPRTQWIIERVGGGCLLEIGCGNGGMTALLAPKVERVVAIDVASSSLEIVASLALQNVETIETLVEHYQPDVKFDWIVMSEVLEHLRRPAGIVLKCLNWLAPGGSLLVSTPNGHWESNEHLQEFDLERFAQDSRPSRRRVSRTFPLERLAGTPAHGSWARSSRQRFQPQMMISTIDVSWLVIVRGNL